jgi:hypothetical protein
LPERVLDEPYAHWRGALAERFAGVAGIGSLEGLLRAVRQQLALLRSVAPERLGSSPTPDMVFASGLHRRGRRDADIAAVAALRCLGVPARAARGRELVEYHDGAGWKVFTRDQRRPEVLDAPAPPLAELAVTFTLDGAPMPPGDLMHARDFAVCRLDERLGFTGLDAAKVREDPGTGQVIIRFPAGERWLSSGRRDKLGRPYVRMERFVLAPGERRVLTRELGLPESPATVDPVLPPRSARPRASR